jgi:DNA-binding GntR family transcriptional regulator
MLPQIDRSSPIPIYQQIQAWIREQIVSETWQENYQLQAEDDLAVELGVNRGTLRNAIKALIDEGYLIRIHGKGTFVARRVVEQPLAQNLSTFSEGLMSQNIPFTTRVLEQRLTLPDEQVASLLDLPEGEPIFFLKRVRLVKDKPAIFLHTYVVARLCPGIERVNFEERRLFDVIERDYKLALAWGRRTFEARTADETVAAVLNIAPGSPVLYARQVTYSVQDIAVEYSDMWIEGSSFRLSALVRRGENVANLDTMPDSLSAALL